MEALLGVQKESGITPDALKRRPKLQEHDLLYLRLFGELNGSRQVGESVGNIPVSEFRHYCDLWEITELEEKERLAKYLKRLDDTFVTFALERRKAEIERAKRQT